MKRSSTSELQRLNKWLDHAAFSHGVYNFDTDLIGQYALHSQEIAILGLRRLQLDIPGEDPSKPPVVFLESVPPEFASMGLVIGEFGEVIKKTLYLRSDQAGIFVHDKRFPDEEMIFADDIKSYYTQIVLFKKYIPIRNTIKRHLFYQYFCAFLSTFSGREQDYDNIMLRMLDYRLVEYH